MFERSWQLSLEAEGRQDFKELQRDIAEVVQNEESLVDMLDSKWDWGQRENLENALEAYLESDFVKKLSDSELTYLKKILNMREDQYWGYGRYVATDGLFAAEVVSESVPTDWADTLVLTGLIGYDLRNQSKHLDQKLTELNQSPLETAILLGGLALAGCSVGQREPSSAYSGTQRNGLMPITRVGATFHGDFMVSREQRFVHDAIDPLGIPRPFGPAIPEAMVGAYHSTEPGILAALLLHQAGRGDKNTLQKLHQKISQRLENSQIISRGNFADYGDGDGEYEARLLADELGGNSHDRDGLLGSFIIQAGYNQAMKLMSTEGGVMFCCQDNREDKEPQDVFLLPNDEIEDFIVALFSNNLGRTSPDALRKVLDVIK